MNKRPNQPFMHLPTRLAGTFCVSRPSAHTSTSPAWNAIFAHLDLPASANVPCSRRCFLRILSDPICPKRVSWAKSTDHRLPRPIPSLRYMANDQIKENEQPMGALVNWVAQRPLSKWAPQINPAPRLSEPRFRPCLPPLYASLS